MKRFLTKWSICIIMLVSLLLLPGMQANAEAPYYTWTEGPGGFMVHTQDAYNPGEMMEPGLKNPEDLFIWEGKLYIADTGNSRILVMENGEVVQEITNEGLESPTGLSVTEDFIYVADYGKKEILVFDHSGQLTQRIGRPDEAIFGANTSFTPVKVSVDKRGNLYVVSQGSTSGVMQLSLEGDFLGYFASNRTNTSFTMILQRTFFTQEQLDQLFKNTPSSVYNIDVDDLGLMYTVTQGSNASEQGQSIRKLSIAGADLISPWVTSMYFVDVAVDERLNIYAVDSQGTIYEYDSYGNSIFVFGYQDSGMQRKGLISDPSAIDVAEDGVIYVLDKSKGVIQTYVPVEFAKMVHDGLSDYMDGRYAEAEQTWQEINRRNTSFLFSYEALGKASFKRQDYDQAMDFYKTAGNVSGYSQAFWYSRNEWIENNLTWCIVILVLIVLLWSGLKRLDKKKGILKPFRTVSEKVQSFTVIKQLKLTTIMLKKPFDGYYRIHYREETGVITSTLLYIWLIILQITDLYITSYLFNQTNPAYVSLSNMIGRIMLPLLLFVVCNYLVSTISGGEGKFKHVYCGTIYALSPYLVLMLPLQIISNVLTENESFLYSFGQLFIICWCGILLYLMVQEVHVFTISQTVKNLCVTVVTMGLFLLAAFTLYLLGTQLWEFVVSIYREVAIRV